MQTLSAQDWIENVKIAIEFRRQYSDFSSWNDYKNYYRHKFNPGVLPVNLVYSILQSLVAQAYIKNPSVTITPTKPGIQNFLSAKVRESVAKYLLRERRTKNEIKKTIRDNFFCGIAAIFSGYDSEFGWSKDTAEEGMNASLTQFDKKGFRLEYNSYINPGMPWALRAAPEDVLWPWGVDEAHNAPWVALRKLRPVTDMRQDKKYSIPADFEGSFTITKAGHDLSPVPDTMFERMHKREQFIEFWQIHDARTGKVYAVAEGVDTFLRNETDEMQIDGLPVTTSCFNPDPDFIYGIPDTKIIEPQLLELIEIRTQAMKHRRVDLVKILIRKGILKPDAINKMTNEDVKAVVEADTEDDLRTVVMSLPSGTAGVLQDMAMSGELCRQDIREMVGFSRVQQGEFQGKSHVTKGEVERVIQRSDIRVDERRDQIADLLVDIVRRDLQIVDTFWTTPQVVDIIGPDGARYWIKYTGPEVKGEYNYVIDPNSDEVVTPETRKKDAIDMAKAWAEMNMGKVKQGVPVPAEIQQMFFSAFPGINVEKLLAEQGIQREFGSQTAPIPINQAAGMIQNKMRQNGQNAAQIAAMMGAGT